MGSKLAAVESSSVVGGKYKVTNSVNLSQPGPHQIYEGLFQSISTAEILNMTAAHMKKAFNSAAIVSLLNAIENGSSSASCMNKIWKGRHRQIGTKMPFTTCI